MTKKLEFQLACKMLRDAYTELKKTVDETPPRRAARPPGDAPATGRPRGPHGQAAAVRVRRLQVGTLLDADLLAIVEEVEDLANSAVKELCVEGKLIALEEKFFTAHCRLCRSSRGAISCSTRARPSRC